ncbi:MAG: hypothetical protein ACLFNK_03455 [Candidatus Woesearchaeota archaeon]
MSLDNNIIDPQKKTHIILLINLLSNVKRLAVPLSGYGLSVYIKLLEPRTLNQLIKETNLHKTTILKKINQGRKMSPLIKEKRTYRINERIWPRFIEFLDAFLEYQNSIDDRVPLDSIIYKKDDQSSSADKEFL